MGVLIFLAIFLGGKEGDFRGIQFGDLLCKLVVGLVGICFCFARTSEKSLEGAGGEPHTETKFVLLVESPFLTGETWTWDSARTLSGAPAPTPTDAGGGPDTPDVEDRAEFLAGAERGALVPAPAVVGAERPVASTAVEVEGPALGPTTEDGVVLMLACALLVGPSTREPEAVDIDGLVGGVWIFLVGVLNLIFCKRRWVVGSGDWCVLGLIYLSGTGFFARSAYVPKLSTAETPHRFCGKENTIAINTGMDEIDMVWVCA